MILSPHSYDIRQMLDDEEWFLWTKSIYGYFGKPESEAKYLPEINGWLARQLETQKDKSLAVKPASRRKKAAKNNPPI